MYLYLLIWFCFLLVRDSHCSQAGLQLFISLPQHPQFTCVSCTCSIQDFVSGIEEEQAEIIVCLRWKTVWKESLCWLYLYTFPPFPQHLPLTHFCHLIVAKCLSFPRLWGSLNQRYKDGFVSTNESPSLIDA